MDSILAPNVDGTYTTVFGRDKKGLFLQRLDDGVYLFRHTSSGLALFYFKGERDEAGEVLASVSESYDFLRDSTWVLKGQTDLQHILLAFGLERSWFRRAWHYHFIRS
jgi:hypothetical protein